MNLGNLGALLYSHAGCSTRCFKIGLKHVILYHGFFSMKLLLSVSALLSSECTIKDLIHSLGEIRLSLRDEQIISPLEGVHVVYAALTNVDSLGAIVCAT